MSHKDQLKIPYIRTGSLFKGTDIEQHGSLRLAEWNWELAKCFLGTSCKNIASTAKDVDASDLLNIAINDSFIRNSISNIDNFKKARTARNNIIHAPDLELDDTNLADYIQIFIEVLLDGNLSHSIDAQNAIKYLNQLKNGEIHITVEDFESMRKYALTAIDERKESVIESLQEEMEKNTSEIKVNILEDLQKQTSKEKEDIRQHTNRGLDEIHEEKNKVIKNINEHESECIRHIHDQFEKMKRNFFLEVRQYLKNSTDVVFEDFEKIRNSKLFESLNRIDLKADDKVQCISKEFETVKRQFVHEITNLVKSIKETQHRQFVEELFVKRKDSDIEHDNPPKEYKGHILCTETDWHPKATDNNDEGKDRSGFRKLDDNVPTEILEISQLDGDHSYESFIQDFMFNLTRFYREHPDINTISLTKESREFDAPLLQVFVLPNMTFEYRDGLEMSIKAPVRTYADILLHSSEPVSSVFISGTSGSGKTVLANHLCLTWCFTREPDSSHFEDIDISTLKHYDFLFLVSIHGNSSSCLDITEIIQKQIVNKLRKNYINYTKQVLINILKRKRCLIIIDNLDRCSDPDIVSKISPHVIGNKVTVLSFTTPFKLSSYDLNFKQMNIKVEMVGLDKWSFVDMSKISLTYLNHLFKAEKDVEGFFDLVQKSELDVKCISRIALMCLLGYWFEDKIPYVSKSTVYKILTKELLSRLIRDGLGFEKVSSIALEQSMDTKLVRYQEPLQTDLSKIVLSKLGGLAFESLLTNKGVVETNLIHRFLSNDEFIFCADNGLLDVNSNKSLTSNSQSIAFRDQSHQANLAACYTSSFRSVNLLMGFIGRYYTCVGKNIFSYFLSSLAGLNPKLFVELTNEIQGCYYSKLEEYRHSCDMSFIIEKRMRRLQDDIVKSVSELVRLDKNTQQFLPHLQDILIDKACEEKNYRCIINKLIAHNKHNIKSITIYYDSLSGETLQLVDISLIPSTKTLAVMGERKMLTSQKKVDLTESLNIVLLDVIQSVTKKSSGALKNIILGGISIAPEMFEEMIDMQNRCLSMRRVDLTDSTRKYKYGTINYRRGTDRSYIYFHENIKYTKQYGLINILSKLRIVHLQNVHFSPHELQVLGQLDKVEILDLWHASLASQHNTVANDKIKENFGFSFKRSKLSLVLRGYVPDILTESFLAYNSQDVRNIKVTYAYLTFECLCRLCGLKKVDVLILKNLSLVSSKDFKVYYLVTLKAFKYEFNSTNQRIYLSGCAQEDVYKLIVPAFEDFVKHIEIRDMVLSKWQLDGLASITSIDFLTLVNIACEQTEPNQEVTMLNTFDMVFIKTEQRMYVYGDIGVTFFHIFIENFSNELNNVDLRYLRQTSECFSSLSKINKLQELSLYYCRSDFEDTDAVIQLTTDVAPSLRLARLGCLSLLSKYLSVNEKQQTESMSFREIIHSSKTKNVKRDLDRMSMENNYCIQWDSASLYIEGETPKAFVTYFLRKSSFCVDVCLKRLHLSQSDLRCLQTANRVETLRFDSVTCESGPDNDIDVLSEEDELSDIDDYISDSDSFLAETEKGSDNNEKSVDDDHFSLFDVPMEEEEFIFSDHEEYQENVEKICTYENEPVILKNDSEKATVNFRFDSFEEKLFVSGDFTDPLLYGILKAFFKLSKRIQLIHVKFRHKRAKEILQIIDRKTDMECIEIENFKCVDHENCNGLTLNVTDHTNLKLLTLRSTYFTTMKVNCNLLNTCKLQSLVFPGIVSSILNSIQPSVIQSLELISIQHICDLNTLVRNVPSFRGLQNLEISWINISDTTLRLCQDLINFKMLILRNVKMPLEVFSNVFFDFSSSSNQYVRIRLHNCKLAEENEAYICHFRDFVTELPTCKVEEELKIENYYFSGIYSIENIET